MSANSIKHTWEIFPSLLVMGGLLGLIPLTMDFGFKFAFGEVSSSGAPSFENFG